MDDDDDELIPAALRAALKAADAKKGKSKLSKRDKELYGVFADDMDPLDDQPDPYAALAAAMGESDAGMFVSGGGLQDQVKKAAPREPRNVAVAPMKRRKTVAPPPSAPAMTHTEQKAKFGIGASLLEKMGWADGKGLGKKGTGITQALDVKVRPAGLGLGMIEEKTASQKVLERQRREHAEHADDDDADAANDAPEDDAQIKWAKLNIPGAGSARRGRGAKKALPVIKLASQVLSEDSAAHAAGVTIIDLTGRVERIVDRSAVPTSGSSASLALQVGRELKYNMDKLCEAAEADLKQHNRRVAAAAQKETTFGQQSDMLRGALTECEAALAAATEAETLLGRLLDSRDEMAQAAATDAATQELVKRLCMAFGRARTKFGDALYKAAGFPDVLFGLVEGPLRAYYGRGVTRPLDMAMASDLKAAWGAETEYWNAFVFQVVVPPFQRFFAREWDVTGDVAGAHAAVMQWRGVWTDEAHHYVVHELVWPRLRAAADEWNPYVAEIPLHSWIHPWHAIFEGRLEKDLYPGLVYRLSVALAEWDPLDGSAYELLRPWGAVFTRSQIESLAQGRIVPKVTALLSSMALTDDAAIEAALKWHDWIPVEAFVKLLARTLFPRLARALYDGLRAMRAGDSYAPAAHWYTGWKRRFPDALLAHDKVRLLFAHLLDVAMNVLAAPHAEPFEPEVLPMDLWADKSARPVPSQPAGAGVAAGAAPADALSNFRAMIEAFAGERNVVFLPMANRTHNGKPLYSFGGVPVLLADQLVFVEQSPSKWVPTSLDHLADLATIASSGGSGGTGGVD